MQAVARTENPTGSREGCPYKGNKPVGAGLAPARGSGQIQPVMRYIEKCTADEYTYGQPPHFAEATRDKQGLPVQEVNQVTKKRLLPDTKFGKYPPQNILR
jgi:hypothetical protein